MENMVNVKSASNFTVVINVPDLSLKRVWKKKGASFPIDRKVLFQAYYDPAVETLFKEGMLVTNDVEFLKEVGLIETEEDMIVELTDTYLRRLVKAMPLAELKVELTKLTRNQLTELGDYAIEHNTELGMDRIDILSKATGKNILKAIEHQKSAMED